MNQDRELACLWTGKKLLDREGGQKAHAKKSF
jgi:hypothetical protein